MRSNAVRFLDLSIEAARGPQVLRGSVKSCRSQRLQVAADPQEITRAGGLVPPSSTVRALLLVGLGWVAWLGRPLGSWVWARVVAGFCCCCAVVRMVRMQQPQAPRAEQRLPRTVRAAHTRRGYSCYIYGMQTSGADRAGAGVEYRVVGGVSCVEAIVDFKVYCMGRVCASHQWLGSPPSGTMSGLEDARWCARV